MSYLKSLQTGLRAVLQNPDCYLLGEDITEPYGGAFKVTKNLSVEFPDQIIAVPMSEQGFTGMGIGMSLAGLKVMVEIMFGDFITLCADQLINHASKFVGLYDAPLHFVLRTPMGGYRGYGATHSQSLEKLFMGYPDIYVVAPSIIHEPGPLLERSLSLGKPVVFVENKLDYTRDLFGEKKTLLEYEVAVQSGEFPYAKVNISNEQSADYALVVYGGLVADALNVIEKLFLEDEISVHLMTPSLLFPHDEEFIGELIPYKNVIVMEEGYNGANWSSEIALQLGKKGFSGKIHTIASKLSTIGASEVLENYVLPDPKGVLSLIRRLELG